MEPFTELLRGYCIISTKVSVPGISLSETCRGWKFGLTPHPSLRSKAHKVIRENLPYIRSQFAFKLSHANFPKCINCEHTTLYKHTAIMKRAFPTLVVLKIPQMFTWVIFEDVENGLHSLHLCLRLSQGYEISNFGRTVLLIVT